MTSTIDHDIRERLKLSVWEYLVADAINKWPKIEQPTVLGLCELFSVHAHLIADCLNILDEAGFIAIGSRNQKISSTKLWRDSIKVTKIEKGTNPLINVLRLATLDIRPDYYWTVMDARWSSELAAKLENSFRETRKQDPTPEEVGNSFRILIQNLPAFWANKWDISKINTQYNSLILEIRENYGKSAREKRGIGSNTHREALELLNDDDEDGGELPSDFKPEDDPDNS